MTFGPAVLLAIALKVGIPAFELENAPAFIGARLSQLLAKELNEGACAQGLPSNELSGPALEDLRGCYGQPSCIASAGTALGVDKLVLGSVHREETRFLVQVLVVDVRKKRVERNITDALPNRVDMLPLAAKRAAKPLCEAFLQANRGDELAIADVQIDTPLAPADFAALPLPELDLDIPDAPAPAPKPTDELALTLPAVDSRPPPPPAATPPPAPAAVPTALVAVAPEPPPRSVPAPPPAPPTQSAPKVTSRPAAPVAVVRPPVAPAKVSRPPPAWAWWLMAGGGAVLAVGGGLGITSSTILDRDAAVVDRSGLAHHSLTRAEALRANDLATAANVSLVAGLGLAAAGGTLVLFPDLLP